MFKIQVFVHKHPDDPSRDLEIAGSLRRDIWAHSPVEIDPDNPENAVKRTSQERVAYFEFDTDFPDEVDRVVREYGYSNQVTVRRLPYSHEVTGA